MRNTVIKRARHMEATLFQALQMHSEPRVH